MTTISLLALAFYAFGCFKAYKGIRHIAVLEPPYVVLGTLLSWLTVAVCYFSCKH